MHLIDFIVFIVFTLGVVVFGCSFFKKGSSADEFTSAGHSIPGWVVGMSIFATYVSSISYIGYPGKAFAADWNAFVFSLSIPIASYFAAKYFVPFYRHSGSVSAYTFLEEKFGAWARIYASACYLLTQIARMGSILYLLAVPMYILMGWDMHSVIILTSIGIIIYSMMGGLSRHPAVVAVSPQAPCVDWFIGDDRHHGGAFTLLQTFDYIPQTEGRYRYTKEIYNKVIRNDVYTDLLKAGTFKDITAILDDPTATFWHNCIKHPDYDEFWKERDLRRSCYDVKPAVLVVGGSYDTEDCFGAWELYKAISKQSPQTESYLVMGPWWHGGWAVRDYTGYDHFYFGKGTTNYYLDEIEFPFFNYYLDGKGSKPMHKVTSFFAGENKWGYFDEWPQKKVEITPFYLHQKGVVSLEKPQVGNSFTEYVSDMEHPVPFSPEPEDHRVREFDDQRFAAARPDVITFVSEPLTDTLRIAGEIEARLFAAISSTDADFVVKLIDEYPDGYRNSEEAERLMERNRSQMGKFQHVVRAEILRGRYRNSYERPEPFVPNMITPVNVRMNDATHTFLPGHSVMIQIQSSWFPLFDRNPQKFINTYTCSIEDFVMKENIRIYHQEDAPSCIMLPVMK